MQFWTYSIPSFHFRVWESARLMDRLRPQVSRIILKEDMSRKGGE